MATKTLNVRFQQKYDTAENWAKSTITLLAGEMAIESDTKKFKFGDGEHTFSELPYAGIDQAQLDAIEDNYYHVVPESLENGAMETDNEALTRAVTNPKKGDIAVCERANGTGTPFMTAYMYSGTAWCALDGNYDATNVYFKDDITLAGSYTQVGNITKSANETKTLSAAGKNIAEVMQSIFTKEINTDLKNAAPSCGMNGNSTKYYVAGEASAEQTITLSLNKGSYDYGYGYVVSKDEEDITAGTAAVTKVTNDGTGVVVDGDKPYTLTWNGKSVTPVTDTTNKFVCESVTKTDAPVQLKCSGTVKYKNAGNPVSNLGNIYPAQAYGDTTSSANEQVLARWYYPIYQGFTYDAEGGEESNVIANPSNITQTQLTSGLKAPIKELTIGTTKHSSTNTNAVITGSTAYDKTKMTKAIAGRSWRQYFVAYPETYSFDMSGVTDSNGLPLTPASTTIDVKLNDNVTVKYKVEYIHNATPYGTRVISWTLS
jgi:hypothetical protein